LIDVVIESIILWRKEDLQQMIINFMMIYMILWKSPAKIPEWYQEGVKQYA
jgi:hypothetical protein